MTVAAAGRSVRIRAATPPPSQRRTSRPTAQPYPARGEDDHEDDSHDDVH